MAGGRMMQEKGSIVSNRRLQEGYHCLRLALPGIASLAGPGQFVHLRIPGMRHRVLRRPFSVCDAEPETGILTVVYKVVGEGTEILGRQAAGTVVDVLGPQGRGFSPLPEDGPAVLLGGGYGCAAVYLLARRSVRRPTVLLGARSRGDIILADWFEALGCPVEISTDDGSLGTRGRVTALLERSLRERPQVRIAACGPTPMLRAVAEMAAAHGLDAELSLDETMCCGVGACFGCVVKCRDAASPEGWRYARSCQEGPVFPASSLYWG